MGSKEIGKSLKVLLADPKQGVKLEKIDTSSTRGIGDKETAKSRVAEIRVELDALQQKLYAEANRGLIIVFQAMDTGGKDGVIRNVFGPLNPQGVNVCSFKRPSDQELARDFLWRVHAQVPAKGMIHIFNRSHYEDVLVHRVHDLLPGKTIEARYRQINDFERHLVENDVVIAKFFLHISKAEQKERLEARLQDPDKRWKFSKGDLEERRYWHKYREAYEAALNECSKSHAPWYVIPADKKWYRDWAVAEIVLATMKRMNPRYPKEQEGLDDVVIE